MATESNETLGDRRLRADAHRREGLANSGSDRRTNGRARRTWRVPPKLYRIGEIVEYANVSRQTIHNYTTMGLLRESRWTPGGHRLYDESVFERLEKVAELKARRMSMREIREYFERLDLDSRTSERADPSDRLKSD